MFTIHLTPSCIVRIGPERGLAAVVALLVAALENDPDPRVRALAALCLMPFSDEPELVAPALPALMDAMEDEDPDVRGQACLFFEDLPFRSRLADREAERRAAAEQDEPEEDEQEEDGPGLAAVAPLLTEAIEHDPDPLARQVALSCLRCLSTRPAWVADVLPAIQAATRDEDEEVRWEAAEFLSDLATEAREASQEEILAAYGDGDQEEEEEEECPAGRGR